MGQPVGHCPTSTEQGMAGTDMEPSLHAELCCSLMEGGIFAGWLVCTGLPDPHRPRATLIVWFCEFKEKV